MRIISFDLSTHCGIALWEDGKVIDTWTHRVPLNKNINIRINSFRKYILKLKDKYNPDEVIFEGFNIDPKKMINSKTGKSTFHPIHFKVQIYLESQVRSVWENSTPIHAMSAYKIIPYNFRKKWSKEYIVKNITKGPDVGKQRPLTSREKKKWLTVKYVREHLNVNVKNDNEADAILLLFAKLRFKGYNKNENT